ncbi:response regulator [Paraburkholderia fungorum]|uniref:response regulator n=1 Tax=Paraburkholderia fungorum TaxID=134537 RepID=UPI0038BD1BFE
MNLRVILADDHPLVLLGVRAALEMHADVTIVGEAATPTSLIELLRSKPCDVLITDLSMPDLSGAVEDGLGLVRRIRRTWPSLRIVVMTTLINAEILRSIVSECDVSTVGKMEAISELWRAIEASGNDEVYVGRSIIHALDDPQNTICEQPPMPRLSSRQAKIIRMLTRGQSIAEIAAVLGCHRRTVSRQKREVMVRLGVANDPGLFSYIRARGIDRD